MQSHIITDEQKKSLIEKINIFRSKYPDVEITTGEDKLKKNLNQIENIDLKDINMPIVITFSSSHVLTVMQNPNVRDLHGPIKKEDGRFYFSAYTGVSAKALFNDCLELPQEQIKENLAKENKEKSSGFFAKISAFSNKIKNAFNKINEFFNNHPFIYGAIVGVIAVAASVAAIGFLSLAAPYLGVGLGILLTGSGSYLFGLAAVVTASSLLFGMLDGFGDICCPKKTKPRTYNISKVETKNETRDTTVKVVERIYGKNIAQFNITKKSAEESETIPESTITQNITDDQDTQNQDMNNPNPDYLSPEQPKIF